LEAAIVGMMSGRTALVVVVMSLSALGCYIAAYFSLVYYGLIDADSRVVPRVCRLDDRTCKTVLETKYARVFGLPNSLLGVLYYIVAITILAGGLIGAPAGLALVAVAWFTVALGVFLTYALFVILRIPCPLCLTGHAINLCLAVILTYLRLQTLD
jgi:uncharacterized membrane protein